MGRDPVESERTVSSDAGSLDELRARVTTLEETVEALSAGSGWRPMRSNCTHCRQGRLVRNGMTVRCLSCGYESG